jgi:hypothetical protein
MPPPEDTIAPYGLRRPTMTDARDAIRRAHGDAGAAVWSGLLKTAAVTGDETDEQSFDRLLRAAAAADPVSRLCAHALRIRVGSYTHLAAAHSLTRS